MEQRIALEVVDEVGSTSEVLKQRAGEGYRGEAALLARRQSAGRGRLGRVWQAPAGNVNLSVLLRPEVLRWPGHWSLLSAVALAEVVQALVPDPGAVRLKWPNDVLLGGGKLSGILVEAEASATPWLVIGFGVNLVAAPDGTGRAVACLAEVCTPGSAEAFAGQLLGALGRWRERYGREGFAPVRRAWLALGPAVGERVAAGAGAARVEGLFSGLGDDGALLIDGGGRIRAVTAGEVE